MVNWGVGLADLKGSLMSGCEAQWCQCVNDYLFPAPGCLRPAGLVRKLILVSIPGLTQSVVKSTRTLLSTESVGRRGLYSLLFWLSQQISLKKSKNPAGDVWPSMWSLQLPHRQFRELKVMIQIEIFTVEKHRACEHETLCSINPVSYIKDGLFFFVFT